MAKCKTCECSMFFDKNEECTACRVKTTPNEWHSPAMLRCPKCCQVFPALQFMCHIKWEDQPKNAEYRGDLTVKCWCGHEFNINCEMAFVFTSPQLLSSCISEELNSCGGQQKDTHD